LDQVLFFFHCKAELVQLPPAWSASVSVLPLSFSFPLWALVNSALSHSDGEFLDVRQGGCSLPIVTTFMELLEFLALPSCKLGIALAWGFLTVIGFAFIA
jgi:hypothetical protein